jgi:hypothetical protein
MGEEVEVPVGPLAARAGLHHHHLLSHPWHGGCCRQSHHHPPDRLPRWREFASQEAGKEWVRRVRKELRLSAPADSFSAALMAQRDQAESPSPSGLESVRGD